MRNNIILSIAWHNMKLYRLRSALTVLGFAIGAAAIMFLLGFGYGLERLVASQISGGDAYLMLDVAPVNQTIAPLNAATISGFADISGVEAVSPEADLSARLTSGSQSVDLALILTDASYFKWRSLSEVEKSESKIGDAKKITINTALATQLAGEDRTALLGKKVTLDVIVPKELAAANDPVSTSREFIVAAIIKEDDAPKVYYDLNNAANLGVVNYTQARVRVAARDSVEGVRTIIENSGFKTNYIGDTVKQINDVFRVFKSILGSLGAVALVIAIIGMFNTLTISLMERVKEIALMKVLGAKKKVVAKLIIAEALIIGVMGAVLGVFLGLACGAVANGVISSYAKGAGGVAVDVFYFPWGLIAATIVGALVVTTLTSLLPVRRANRVSPLNVFRYE